MGKMGVKNALGRMTTSVNNSEKYTNKTGYNDHPIHSLFLKDLLWAVIRYT